MTRISHVGIVVRNLRQAQGFYSLLGLNPNSSIQEIPQEGVRISRLFPARQHPIAPDAGIELLEPIAANSPVARFLDRQGPGLHHIAVQVDDLVAVLERLHQEGIRLTPGGMRQSPEGHSYFFIHPSGSGGVLVEVCQATNPAPRAK